MTPKIQKMLENLKSGAYKQRRTLVPRKYDFNDSVEHAMQNYAYTLSVEQPYIDELDDFGFNFSTNVNPAMVEGNVIADYKSLLTDGFISRCKTIEQSIAKTTDEDKKAYGKAMLDFANSVFTICDAQKEEALQKGNTRLAKALERVPRQGAESFYEALVFMKILIYFWRISGANHQAMGRFDQYMYPFYLHDKAQNVSDDELLELLESFFISINRDADLYAGVQQGDNGQSIVLGGFDKDGNNMFNPLSELCMQASLELNLIDPKINLRVGKNTPDAQYILGTKLTKQGLGFPQYCNDDVVVPGLVKLGYDLEDALEYGVAACWEYIVPGYGVDYPNLRTFDFPGICAKTVQEKLESCDTFSDLMQEVNISIENECERLILSCMDISFIISPNISFFMRDPINTLINMRHYAKYTNFGCHGAGISNATDALTAIKKTIYDDKSLTKQQLLQALTDNFEGHEEIRNLLRDCPKMGNNDDYADNIATRIMSMFSNNLNGKDNGHGGVWRAGTGSAMEYIWKGEKCPATADGRKMGEPYSSSFSPSLDCKTTGLLSVIQSFTKYDMTEIINGGPLTLEIHDTVLKNDIGIEKTAMLVKQFVLLGGHQLQLNSINRETLLDAQKHPEKYPNLIVRVWGWSGYFNELDIQYQNHVIRRTEYLS